MNITLKEIPDELHQKLRQRAETHGRSLNKEVLSILEMTVNPVRKSSQDLLRQISDRRDKMAHVVKDEELKGIIEEGRL
ncbi:MAG: Arc family DNA-binding protein [Opitutales bacterium]|nr:Arc family DNA-binding protein [Opitutales bacterium]